MMSTTVIGKSSLAKSEALMYCLGDVSKLVRKYSKGSVTKDAVRVALSRVEDIFSQDETHFRSTFSNINSRFSDPLDVIATIRSVAELEKGMIKKYSLKHPSFNHPEMFYAKHLKKALDSRAADGPIAIFNLQESFPARLRTYTEEILTQIERSRSLKRKDKDKLKKDLLTSFVYLIAGIITPIANSKMFEDPDGSSISLGRIFLSAIPIKFGNQAG
jgi:hypothetical protein